MKNSVIYASMTKFLVMSSLVFVFFACEKNPPTESTSSEGTLKGVFSVSAGRQVRFSKGNLQYQASTGTWRFAEHQYDYIGDDYSGTVFYIKSNDTIKYSNESISETYKGWIDLFGFGTSGYKGKKPTMTTTDFNQYGDGNKNIAGTDYDWGRYNKIANGGNVTKNWRTLTSDEWRYLAMERPNAEKLRGSSSVNGVSGYIFLPDDYINVTIKSNYADSLSWAKMEDNGAIFLPCAGYRYDGNKVINAVGRYWSTSVESLSTAGGISVTPSIVFAEGYTRSYGQSVRLVQDVK